MQPVISIVGRSESGKTTLLEGLIAELKRRGYRVAVMKHSAEDFELDTVNKDSWRFSRAGSEISAIISGGKLAIFKRLENEVGPEELSHLSWEYDVTLTEGFKRSPYPKIEVHRREQGKDLLSPREQLIAVVTDEPLEIDVPQFSRDQVQGIADLIEGRVLAQRRGDDIDLFVNGVNTPLGSFARGLLVRTLIALIAGFRGTGEIKSLHISLRRTT